MAGTHQAIPRGQVTTPDRICAGYDVWLAGAALALTALGIVMVASASISIAERDFEDPFFYFSRQAMFLALGLGLAWGALQIEMRIWCRASPILLVLGISVLALILIPGVGREVNGSVRWLRFGSFGLQPSEPMKLFLILYLAGYLVRRSVEVRSVFSGFFKPMLVLGIIAGLLLLEPDYGTTVVIFTTALGMMFLAGVPFFRFMSWMSLVTLFLTALVFAAPYRLERLTTFVNPWADPFGSGFQLTQALIAIGRGEWFGVGLGNSIQKLFYLPEAHTDFLFAVLAEELGMVGIVVVIGLFSWVTWRAFAIARRAELVERLFEAYVAYGIGLLIGLQAFVNIGVNMGMLPTKGLTLPLMSYGGSSMLTHCLCVGVLLRIDFELRAGR
jgi:cell division protein FtsW